MQVPSETVDGTHEVELESLCSHLISAVAQPCDLEYVPYLFVVYLTPRDRGQLDHIVGEIVKCN